MLDHPVKVNVLDILGWLTMMVIYLPVKFQFDWTKHFRVRVRERKC